MIHNDILGSSRKIISRYSYNCLATTMQATIWLLESREKISRELLTCKTFQFDRIQNGIRLHAAIIYALCADDSVCHVAQAL